MSEATTSTSKTSGSGTDAENMGIKQPTSHPLAQAGGVSGVPNDWNDAVPSDGSPVKTALRPPAGHVPYSRKPKTVAEHNAYVDEMSAKRFPVRA